MTIDALHLTFIATTFAASLIAVILFFKQKPENAPNIEAIELKSKVEGLTEQLNAKSEELRQEEERNTSLNEQMLQSARSEASAREKLNSLDAEIVKLTNEVSELKAKLEAEREAKNQAEKARTSFEEQKKALEKSISEQKNFIEEAQKNLKDQFENISNKQLEQSAEKFIKNSSENLGNLLNPLKDNIENFKKEIAETYNKESRERFALGKEIERIVDVNNKMTSTTENLTKALKGDRKMQGNWGEMLLEKLLEDSGLKKDTHYTTQDSFKNEEGQTLLPDFRIKLPEGKHIIIDSKVSLVSYERYFNEDNDEMKVAHARNFVDSVKAHVKGLSSKRYQDNKDGSTLDFVIMFMPIEGTFQFLSQYAPDIFQFGWANKVVITSPVTLFPVLQTISSIWKVEAQNKNTQEIIRTATSLYDKFVNFGLSIEEIGKHIEKTESAYKTAISRLSDGRGSIITTVKSLESFGIEKKGSKKLPSFMKDDDATDTKQKSVTSDDNTLLQEDAA